MSRQFRDWAKGTAFGAATIAVSPLLATYKIRSWFLGSDRALLGSSQLLSLVPGLAGQYLRRAFLCRTLAHCHSSVTIEFGTLFSKAGARLDENVYLGPMCHIGLADIERDVLIGAGVHIPSGPMTHSFDDPSRPIREQKGELRQIRIGAGAWIGSASIVLADVGRDTVVAAGAVVSRPLPEKVLAAGIPAKVVRSRFENVRSSDST